MSVRKLLCCTLMAAVLFFGAIGFEALAAVDTTSTSGSCTLTTIVINQPTSCTVTVSNTGANGNGTPQGSVTLGVSGGSGTFSNSTCGSLSGGQCTFDYTPSATAGTHTLTLNYSSSNGALWSNSSGSIDITVHEAELVLLCSQTPLPVNATTACTATVTDKTTGLPVSGGTTTFSNSPAAQGSFDTTTCTLDSHGQCSVNYTPSNADTPTHTITGTYGPASDTYDQIVSLRAADILVVCDLSHVFVGQTTTCNVSVFDDTTAGSPITPQGSVAFDDNGKAGTFSAASCNLDVNGTCSVDYTPAAGDAGSDYDFTTITGTYTAATGPSVHASGSGDLLITIHLRPTSTMISCTPASTYVNETITCTVTVKDEGPAASVSAPTGTVIVATSAGANFVLSACSALAAGAGQSTCTFTYKRTAIPIYDSVVDTFGAAYSGSTTHSSSIGSFSEAISRRTTSTSISCPNPIVGTIPSATTTCTATVTDTAGGSGASDPVGTLVSLEEPVPSTIYCTISAGACTADFSVTVTAIVINLTAKYLPSDDIHMRSYGSTNVFAPDSSLPTTPSGAKNVAQIIYGLNAACLSAVVASLALDVVELFWDPTPDPVVVAGVLVASGTTVPTSDLIASLIGGARIVLAVFGLTACTDLDSDDIPGVVELNIGTQDSNFDSDSDSFPDGDEIFAAAGLFGGTPKACPDPTDDDSDDDGLKDGAEGQTYQVDYCLSDTDGDTIPDGYEVATSVNPSTPTNNFNTTTFAALAEVIATGGIGQFPFASVRDHLNPREQDNDGDGLSDDQEWWRGCGQASVLGGTTTDDLTDGYANDSDSDGDSYIDGLDVDADVAVASGNDGELSNDSLNSICDSDSDGDGTLDGLEVSTGTDSLDWDSDDDGLGDNEELQTYFSDPNNDDTDDDAADGEITTRDASIAPLLTGYAGPDTIDCLSDCEEAFSITFQGNFVGEPRDETDPLQTDTDGDGIDDDLEFNPGCSGGADGFANSFDSDGDGASDGIEFTNVPALDGDIADSNGNDGELNDDVLNTICDPDSDGDALLDGHELGHGTDLRDWDTDEDGLSDREELLTYFTDPNLADTDADTADGVLAARTSTFTDAAHPALTGHSGNGTIACLSDCEEVFSGTTLFNPFFVPVVPPGLTGFGNPLDETDPLQIDTDGDGINDNIEFAPGCNDGPGGAGTGSFLFDGFANSFDSDADGLRDYEDAVGDVFDATSITLDKTPVTRTWAGLPETPAPVPGGNKAASPDSLNDGELSNDSVTGICDADSDGDGLSDGEEYHIGTDGYDWDTDDDGRDDGEYLGEGPIPSDPFDFDTDDDGLGDGVEVFGSNTTNPLAADTDGDGLCDGGATTPASNQFGSPPTGGVDGAGSNPRCYTGVNDHPNPNGFGEDLDGDGFLPTSVLGDSYSSGCTPSGGACETNPNDPDSDSDGNGDGVESLAFSTARSTAFTDVLGRPSRVVYPPAANPPLVFSCMNPLDTDSDDDGLTDGFEDYNHDGNFDFLPQDFDFPIDSLGAHFGTEPEETNPCDADTDDDSNPGSSNSMGATGGNSSDAEERARRTNPLDFDSDNDLLDDGVEVAFVCVMPAPVTVDDDGDLATDEDPIDGIDNDGDGKIDEDPPNFMINFVPNLDPMEQDSDADGWIDGLEDFNFNDQYEPGIGENNPCASLPIPLIGANPPGSNPPDSIPDGDKDGFGDGDELAAGTDPQDPRSHPTAFIADLDLDTETDDRLWLEDPNRDGIAEYVALDINSNVQVDARIEIIRSRDYKTGDFDKDGTGDDCSYTITYAFANGRQLHPRIVLSIFDYNCDLKIDVVSVDKVS